MQSWGVINIYQHAACLSRPISQNIVVVPPTTWNPSDKDAQVTLTNGNLTAECGAGAGSFNSVRSTTSKTSAAGKRYFENLVDSRGTTLMYLGIGTSGVGLSVNPDAEAGAVVWQISNGNISANGVTVGTEATLTNGDVGQIAIDFATQKIWFGKNNTFGGNPSAGTGGYSFTNATYFCLTTLSVDQVSSKFDGGFTFTPPTGFSAWGA